MNGQFALVIIFLIPVALILWNKQRVKGKMLCYIIRKDKSVVPSLCELRSDFVIYKERAYDVYPDFVRVVRFPTGWPTFLQELVPSSLYDEEDGRPLDWVNLANRIPAEDRSMNLRSALDENWLRKLVHETATEGGGPSINWRKIIPIALLVVGVVGLVMILGMRGCALPGVTP